jgi:hypothetical protein
LYLVNVFLLFIKCCDNNNNNNSVCPRITPTVGF